jgi:hypothetical protein
MIPVVQFTDVGIILVINILVDALGSRFNADFV